VIKAFGKSIEEEIGNLYSTLYNYSQFDREERIKNKIEARRLAALADWDKLIENYITAYKQAIEKTYSRETP